MAAARAEVDGLRTVVERYFKVYGVIVTPLALTFQVAPGASPENAFDGLRKELIPRDYIPSMTRERGELLVHVQRRPPQRFRSLRVNVLLLFITIITTIVFGGAYNWSVYSGANWLSADSLLNGALFFSLPLLAILGFHEMGHYVVAKRYHVRASLPFFLPSAPPFGTFGAFISMRDPIPNRRALLDIGAAGPLVGFAIAIPVTLAGLFLTALSPQPLVSTAGGVDVPQASIMYEFLSLFFPISTNGPPHPLAFAGWVGLFVTAINLLPASQLDGGHIARALLGTKQYYASWASFLFLLALGLGGVAGVGAGVSYSGWLLFAFFIYFIGLRHPPPLSDLGSLGVRRTVVGLVAVAVLVVTFVPVPFTVLQSQPTVVFETPSGGPLSVYNVSNASPSSTVWVTFAVNNTGNVPASVRLSFDPSTQNLINAGFSIAIWNVTIGLTVKPVNGGTATFSLGAGQRALVNVSVHVPAGLMPSVSPWHFNIEASVAGGSNAALSVLINVT